MADNILVPCACGCGELLNPIDKKGRPRRFVYSHRSPRPLAEKFWEKVNKTESCWEWTGAVSDKTNLNSGRRGYIGVKGKTRRASRVAWELTYGEIPNSLFVCHHCDNPLCVRPDHLFLGTHQENVKDRDAKGRVAHGDNHGWAKHPDLVPRGSAAGGAKLTEEDVLKIRCLYEQGNTSYKKLGDQYGVDLTTIRCIIKKRTWNHV